MGVRGGSSDKTKGGGDDIRHLVGLLSEPVEVAQVIRKEEGQRATTRARSEAGGNLQRGDDVRSEGEGEL